LRIRSFCVLTFAFYEICKICKNSQIRFITSLVTAKSSHLHSSWEQFFCNRLHWDNCWVETMGSWGLWFWHWRSQWSCRRFI